MKVLIGYDSSESADSIFEDLKRAGLPPDTEAVVATVGEVWIQPPGINLPKFAFTPRLAATTTALEQSDRSTKQIEEIASQALSRVQADFPDWWLQTHYRTGDPGDVLIEKANEWKADLIVVGTRNRSAIGQIFRGSVSKRIVTDSRCSVRVARRRIGKDETAPLQLAVKDGDAPPRIIVGVDGSLAAEQAIYAVGQRVWQDGTEVRLVAVDDGTPPTRIATRLPQAANMINSYFQTRESRVSSMLEWATEELGNINLKTSVLQEKGDPKTVLLAEAEKWNADSIFVGTRDFKSGFERFRLGSVSTAVETNAPCSVEIVRPTEKIKE
jgi:nucleotide-binding universal stress UspA family protein